jgi:hypothetical protein
LNYPETLLNLIFGEPFEKKFRLPKQLKVIVADPPRRKCHFDMEIPRIVFLSLARNTPSEQE